MRKMDNNFKKFITSVETLQSINNIIKNFKNVKKIFNTLTYDFKVLPINSFFLKVEKKVFLCKIICLKNIIRL